jgi:hypothetical protein
VARTVNEPNVYVRGSYSYLSFAPPPGQMQYTTVAGNTLAGGTVAYTGYDYVSGSRTRVTIDPNIRVRGNGTYAGFEDVTGPIAVGEAVEVYEPESGLTGEGSVTEIDADRQLIYLSVNWPSLTEEAEHQTPTPMGAVLYISASLSTGEDDWVSASVRPSLAYVSLSNATLWVTAPAQGWASGGMSPGFATPYLEICSPLEILQPYAGLTLDQLAVAP